MGALVVTVVTGTLTAAVMAVVVLNVIAAAVFLVGTSTAAGQWW